MRRFDKGPPPETNRVQAAAWRQRWVVSEEVWRQGTNDQKDQVRHDARDHFDRQDKDQVRRALCGEQRHLCAFCMGRIAAENPVTSPFGTVVAHVISIRCDPSKVLEWTNVVGSCIGGSETQPHCDRAQGSQSIPLSPVNATAGFDEWFVFTEQGMLQYEGPDLPAASKAEVERLINEVLRLNCQRLTENRKAVLEKVRERLRPHKGQWTASVLRAELDFWTATRPEALPYTPVAERYLRKKLRQVEGSH